MFLRYLGMYDGKSKVFVSNFREWKFCAFAQFKIPWIRKNPPPWSLEKNLHALKTAKNRISGWSMSLFLCLSLDSIAQKPIIVESKILVFYISITWRYYLIFCMNIGEMWNSFHTCQVSLILTETAQFCASLRFSLIFIHFSLNFRSSLNYAVFQMF